MLLLRALFTYLFPPTGVDSQDSLFAVLTHDPCSIKGVISINLHCSGSSHLQTRLSWSMEWCKQEMGWCPWSSLNGTKDWCSDAQGVTCAL